MALLLAFQLALGVAMPKDQSAFQLYQFHKSVGIVILVLTLVRLGWRLAHTVPPALEGGLLGVLARVVHAGFYLLLVLIPLTGWALVSTADIKVPTILFGVVQLPHLPLPSSAFAAMEQSHTLLSWLAILLILLHVAGAARHQFLKDDQLIQRMAPRRSAAAAWLFSLLVIGGGLAFPIAATLLDLDNAAQEKPDAAIVLKGSDGSGLAVIDTAGGLREADREASALEASPEAPAKETATPGASDGNHPPLAWSVQPGGRLSFSVKNGNDMIDGSFAEWKGTILFDLDKPETANLRIEVNLASASVGDATMDGMLRGAEFLAAEAHPTAVWQSTSVRRTGENRYRAEGRLSLKGVSRSQPIIFALFGKGQRRRVEGSSEIDRAAFGVGSGPSANGLAASVSLDFSFTATGSSARN